MHPHLSGDVGQHLVAVFEFDSKHRIRERFDNRSFEHDRVFFGLRQGGSSWNQGRSATLLATRVRDSAQDRRTSVARLALQEFRSDADAPCFP